MQEGRNRRLAMDVIFIVTALASVGFAAFSWWNDGAWHYGAMPTKGLIRTFLLGGGGILLVLFAAFLQRKAKD